MTVPRRASPATTETRPGRRARAVVLIAVLLTCLAALGARGTADRLSQGGWTPATAESLRADSLLASGFEAGAPHLVLLAETSGSVDAAAASRAGLALTTRIAAAPHTAWIRSYWTGRNPALRSGDGHSAIVLVRFHGDEQAVRAASRATVAHHAGRAGPLTIAASGQAPVLSETERLSARGLLLAEVVAAPLVLLVLLWVFGSLLAALLPLLVGAFAVLATTAVIHRLAGTTTVSVFALSITTALGFALAVDYSLLLVSRFREEHTAGAPVERAVRRTLRTAGRAVAFSSATIAVSLCALLLFPLPLLRSIAYGGIAVVLLSAAGSLVLLPALLVLLGRHLDRCDPFARLRRPARPVSSGAWYRLALAVMRRPTAVALGVLALLALLAYPATQVRLGMYDDRILPPSSPVAQASQRLRARFATAALDDATVVLPGLRVTDHATRLHPYAAGLSRIPGVRQVDTATGSYRHGRHTAQPGPQAARFTSPAGTWISLAFHTTTPFSPEGSRIARQVRAQPPPHAGPVLVGGPGAQLADTTRTLTERLPAAVATTVVLTFLLLVAYTRSVLIPLKALVLNTLTLAATAGVLVAVFQQGVGGFGGAATGGVTDIVVPSLMFCVAFGLSMDYEVFLLSRIIEEHRSGHPTSTAVAVGLQHTGRLFTSAALVFATVMACLTLSDLVLLKLVGTGLAVAVVLDCTLVRALLVPAAMRLAGRANWWTPRVRRGPRPGEVPAQAAPSGTSA
ncbi:MMPL family transporter [Streptomyces roseolilacinus]|uniref:Membrane protein n=1 Tax=Streptomyces roseolilacinus TaxID=66904 RepID=A0A918EJN3_9ACTN|nr:MMPL family transporter [Streptomyces roseolilacinus]GGQ08106.1 membrane protein [Streptomyces roseolilacinus]